MPDPNIVVEKDAETLAATVAERLDEAIDEALRTRKEAHVVLTGGSMGEAVMKAWAARRSEHDWFNVNLWWGDERYVAADDDDRNDKQAADAGLTKLPVPSENIHRMPADDGTDVEDAAAEYAARLAEYAQSNTDGLSETPPVPTFDVVMLGMGADGHVASLFPQHPAQNSRGVVVAVEDSPKPPPTRLTLTFDALQNSREVWLVVAGEEKAEAIAAAPRKRDPWNLPVSNVHGVMGTTYFLDTAAAAQIDH